MAKQDSPVLSAITNFLRSRVHSNPIFMMSQLTKHIANYQSIVVAPGTPERLMRSMRAKGTLRYECINRAKSLYRVYEVSR